MKCDILVLAALNEERAPFLSLVRSQSTTHRRYVGKHFTYEVFQLFDVFVAIPVMSGMGQLNAAITACKTLDDISPKFIMLLGIAGCMLERGAGGLGDIAISESIIDYEIQKIHDDKIEYRDVVYQCAPQLIRQDHRPPSWANGTMASQALLGHQTTGGNPESYTGLC